jgi:hypothetical protein
MKFPKGTNITSNNPLYQKWCATAIEMTVEYGIQIETQMQYDDNSEFQSLYFEVDGHRFECLKDLRRALENKAFL